jgi:hypothetical protein
MADHVALSQLTAEQTIQLKKKLDAGIKYNKDASGVRRCIQIARRLVGEKCVDCVCGNTLTGEYTLDGNYKRSFCPLCDGPEPTTNKVSANIDNHVPTDEELRIAKEESLKRIASKEKKNMTVESPTTVTVVYDLADLLVDTTLAKEGGDLNIISKLNDALDNLSFSTMKDAKMVMSLQDGLASIQALLKIKANKKN